jgi:flagellar hook-length control protein FliK
VEELPEAHLLELPLTSTAQQSVAASPPNGRKFSSNDAANRNNAEFREAYDSAGQENAAKNASATNDESPSKETDVAEAEPEIRTVAEETGDLTEEIPLAGTDVTPAPEAAEPEFAVSVAIPKTSGTGEKSAADDANIARPAAERAAPISAQRKGDLPQVPETPDRRESDNGRLPGQVSASTTENLVLSKVVTKEPGENIQITPKAGAVHPHQDNPPDTSHASEMPRGIRTAGAKSELPGPSAPEPIPTTSHEKPSTQTNRGETPRFAEEPITAEKVAPAIKLQGDTSSPAVKKVFQIAQLGGIDSKAPPVLVESGDADAVIQLDQRAPGQIASAPIGQIVGRAETPTMIARQMAEAFQNLPDRPVEISLNPRELGRVRMNISTVEAGITVNVVAERPETLDLLRRNIEQLAREFQAMGYSDINFAFAEGHTRERFENESAERKDEAPTKLNLETVETIGEPKQRTAGTSGVDIRL